MDRRPPSIRAGRAATASLRRNGQLTHPRARVTAGSVTAPIQCGRRARNPFASAAAALLLAAARALCAPFPRSADPAGSVVARRSGEEVRFTELAGWNAVELTQNLLGGDVLRTNAAGQLAVLFADHTQMRLARNTTLVAKAVGAAAGSAFELQRGSIWSRDERGGLGLTIETPAAAAIRATDFALTVEGDRTALTVLERIVTLSNAQGSVTVRQGEAAAVRIGEAPTKTVIADPANREQMLTYLSLRSAFSALAPTPLPGAALRAERARLAGIPRGRARRRTR